MWVKCKQQLLLSPGPLAFFGPDVRTVRSSFALPIATASTRSLRPTRPFTVVTYFSRVMFPSANDFETCQYGKDQWPNSALGCEKGLTFTSICLWDSSAIEWFSSFLERARENEHWSVFQHEVFETKYEHIRWDNTSRRILTHTYISFFFILHIGLIKGLYFIALSVHCFQLKVSKVIESVWTCLISGYCMMMLLHSLFRLFLIGRVSLYTDVLIIRKLISNISTALSKSIHILSLIGLIILDL